MVMMAPQPTRFNNGITTCLPQTPFENFGYPDPTKWNVFSDDFMGTMPVATYSDGANWIKSATGASTVAFGTAAAAGESGVILLTNTAGGTDFSHIQRTPVSHVLNPTGFTNTPQNYGKRWILWGRMSTNNQDETIGFGMQAANTTGILAGLVNGLMITKSGASSDVVFRVTKASSSIIATATAVYPTAGITTYLDVAMAFDGYNEIQCYAGQSTLGGTTPVKRASIAINPSTQLPVVAMAPIIGQVNTTANARTMQMDYFGFAMER